MKFLKVYILFREHHQWKFSGPDASFGVKTSEGTCSDQKFTEGPPGQKLGEAENPEIAISGAATPEFAEGFRERDAIDHANDFTVPPDPNNMGLKEGNQYEMVVGRHPNEREVRGMKAGFQKPKFRKLSERDFVDKIGHCGCRNPNCWICFLVDGVPMRFMKTVDPFKDERPAYKFNMDTITYGGMRVRDSATVRSHTLSHLILPASQE